MTTTVNNEDGNRDVQIVMIRGPDVYIINRMFNKLGTETFDPTLTVEVEIIGGHLLKLKPGDMLDMEVEIL